MRFSMAQTRQARAIASNGVAVAFAPGERVKDEVTKGNGDGREARRHA
jgi:hypothetical protein